MSPVSIEITTLSTGEHHEWDDYVIQSQAGTFFHLSGWRNVLEDVYGHPTHYLAARSEGRVVGVLPLGHIKSRIFGNALVSTPFCVYGGALADNDTVRGELERAAEEKAIELGCDHLELRHMHRTRNDWPVKELYVTFRKTIDPDPDVNMKAIPRKQRAMVRKGIKAGLQANADNDLDRFYRIYSQSVRDHGTPVFPRNYFSALREIFGDACEIMNTTLNGKPVSTVMSFYFKDEVLPYYGGGTRLARSVKGFDFQYWELMRRAAQNGYRIFDYGRSKVGTGSYSFKKNWGFEPQPLEYQYRLVKAKDVPDVNPLNPKYQLFIKAWQRLPLPVANTLGPLIARYLG